MRWTVGGLEIDAPSLSLSGVRAFAQGLPVAISSVEATFEPVSGSLSALLDGDPATDCVFSAPQVHRSGFRLHVFTDTSIDAILLEGGQVSHGWMQAESGAMFVYASPAPTGTVLSADKPLHPDLLASAPAGFWALDDIGATQRDRFGGRSGTRYGGSATLARRAFDDAVMFDPLPNGYVRIPNVAPLDAGQFTVMFDFVGLVSENLAVLEHGTDNSGWSAQIATAGQGSTYRGLWLQMGGQNSGGVTWYSTRPIADGVPHRVCFVYRTATDVRIFVDGLPSTARTAGTPRAPVYNTTYIDIGSRGGSPGVPGGIGNLAIFSRALSDEEVLSLRPQSPRLPSAAELYAPTQIQGDLLPDGMYAHNFLDAHSAVDSEFGGLGSIYGTVELYAQGGNIPLPRRVRLHRSRDGLLVRETWSNAQGEYSFDHISERYTYDVIAWDHEGLQRSVVANDLTPEEMP